MRLFLPAYRIKDAARYASVSTQTVAAWHKLRADGTRTLSAKNHGEALSYMQLIEVAAIASLRAAGYSLQRIRDFRAYVAKKLEAEFPFAQYKFKTDGERLAMDYELFESATGNGKLIEPDKGGQLAWSEIIGDKLEDFEYHKGLARRWYVTGKKSSIVIDPQIAFGAPVVNGTPTWVLKGRYDAGEPINDIADDFSLKRRDVLEALNFEGVDTQKQSA